MAHLMYLLRKWCNENGREKVAEPSSSAEQGYAEARPEAGLTEGPGDNEATVLPTLSSVQSDIIHRLSVYLQNALLYAVRTLFSQRVASLEMMILSTVNRLI